MLKKSLTALSLIVMTFIAIATTSCQSSDPETEKAIAGTWRYSYSEKEDGITMTAYVTESYSLDDHRFEAELVLTFCYPINEKLCTVTYSGEWEASKKELTTYIDENSVEFSFNKSITDRSDREGFKSEMLRELKKQGFCEVTPFESAITDSFETIDEDGERITYHRVN